MVSLDFEPCATPSAQAFASIDVLKPAYHESVGGNAAFTESVTIDALSFDISKLHFKGIAPVIGFDVGISASNINVALTVDACGKLVFVPECISTLGLPLPFPMPLKVLDFNIPLDNFCDVPALV